MVKPSSFCTAVAEARSFLCTNCLPPESVAKGAGEEFSQCLIALNFIKL